MPFPNISAAQIEWIVKQVAALHRAAAPDLHTQGRAAESESERDDGALLPETYPELGTSCCCCPYRGAGQQPRHFLRHSSRENWQRAVPNSLVTLSSPFEFAPRGADQAACEFAKSQEGRSIGYGRGGT
jgi:hypothetical protein